MYWSVLTGLIVGSLCGWWVTSRNNTDIDHVRSRFFDHASEVGVILDDPVTVQSTQIQDIWEIKFSTHSCYPAKGAIQKKRYVCDKQGLMGFKILSDKIE